MYRVIIVENEEIILKGLVYSIPWADIGCIVVGQGSDGREGVELIKLHQPDIVLLDVSMPVLSGTGMLRETYEDYCYSAIVLSAYPYFQYAQDAMAYGAIRYLLKPLKQIELLRAVEEAKKQCNIRRVWVAHKKEQADWMALHMGMEPLSKAAPSEMVQAMLDYAEANYRDRITLQAVAETLNYSIASLNKGFKKQMGTTYIEYVNRLRIQKAMNLIKAGADSLNDVSELCGFEDSKYFSSVFKKYIGCSPKEYAANVNGWLV